MQSNNKLKVGEITQDEREIFESISNGKFSNMALMKIKLNGIETSCICSVNQDKDLNFLISPLAILVNNDILKNFEILCPKGDPPHG